MPPKTETPGYRPVTRQTGVPVEPAATIDASTVPTRDDIVAIHRFWPSVPWLFDASDKVIGFRVPVYLVSGQTEKGEFVPAPIHVWLHTIDRAADGSVQRSLAHEWNLDAQTAMGMRVRKVAVGGHYYGLVLTWPENLHLLGREIEVTFGYQRGDGRLISSPPKRFSVPVPAGYRHSAVGAPR